MDSWKYADFLTKTRSDFKIKPIKEMRRNGREMLSQDLCRMEMLPGNLYNFHPGAHTGQGTEKGIELIADALNELITPRLQTTVLLETMAGKGSEIGGTFEELREIIDRVACKEKIGVCFDTCHPLLQGLPFILETPNDEQGYIEEIHTVKSWMGA